MKATEVTLTDEEKAKIKGKLLLTKDYQKVLQDKYILLKDNHMSFKRISEEVSAIMEEYSYLSPESINIVAVQNDYNSYDIELEYFIDRSDSSKAEMLELAYSQSLFSKNRRYEQFLKGKEEFSD